MPLLSEAEYHATMATPMRRVDSDAEPPFDFWAYFEQIPLQDFEGHDCSEGAVDYAWIDPTGRFQHALVKSEDKNTHMVLVLDLASKSVHGHRLLDLNREYGLNEETA